MLLHENSLLLGFGKKDFPFLVSKSDFVTNVTLLSIPKAPFAYNGAIIEDKEGYRLFFRQDQLLAKNKSFSSHIGSILLSSDWNVIEKEPIWIDTKSDFSEDARVIRQDDALFLLFNELDLKGRSLRLLELDSGGLSFKEKIFLPNPSQKVEKNWTLFFHEKKSYFHYLLSPQKTLFFDGKNLQQIGPSFFWNSDVWEKRWGSIRGGTCAQMIEGSYLAFFHSSFSDPSGRVWYVMGAYTFAARPPFHIEKISKAPIFFDGIYDSRHKNSAKPYIFSIYPMGFCSKNGKVYLSCGENDSAIKVLEIEQKELLKSLEPIGLV